MRDIYDISDEMGVSIRALMKLDKLGYLELPVRRGRNYNYIRKKARRGLRLGDAEIFYLAENPSDMDGIAKFLPTIREAVDSLGDYQAEKMPAEISGYIYSAAHGDWEAVKLLAHWFCLHIDRSPAFANGAMQSQGYMVARMLADIPDTILDRNSKVVTQVMWKCRHTKAMKGYHSFKLETGPVRYHRPALEYDL